MHDLNSNLLISWTRVQKTIVLIIAASFLVLTLAELHGYSLAAWHDEIDDSPYEEILFGKPRVERSDDWLVDLSSAYAQYAHTPRFPVINKNIGMGQNMLTVPAAPVLHPVAIFRPWTWGYFIDPSIGTSWSWWFRVFGLLTSTLLVGLLLTRNATAIAILGSICFLYSPVIQYWSLNASTLIAMAEVATIAFAYTVFASARVTRTVAALVTGWAVGSFVTNLYPPYQITIAYCSLALTFGICVQRRDSALGFRLRRAMPYLGISLLIAAAAAISLYVGIYDEIPRIVGSAYPGQRLVAGGALTLSEFLAAMTVPAAIVEDWQPLVNICEAATPLLFGPFCLVALLLCWRSHRQLLLSLLPLLLVYTVLLIHDFWGLPGFLSHLLLIDRVPEGRTKVALGFADLILLMTVVGHLKLDIHIRRSWLTTAALVAQAITLIISLYGASRLLNSQQFWPACLFSLALMFIAFRLLSRPVWALGLLAGISVVSTFWYNPLARGGYAYLVNNPLSQAIVSIDQRTPGGSRWLAFGPIHIGNLFRILGVKSATGVIYTPQPELWRWLDPDGADWDVFNRYAHIGYLPRIGISKSQHKNVNYDGVLILVDPDDPALAQMGIDHFLARSSLNPPAAIGQFKLSTSYTGRSLYSRSRP